MIEMVADPPRSSFRLSALPLCAVLAVFAYHVGYRAMEWWTDGMLYVG